MEVEVDAMRAIVCGGRGYNDPDQVLRTLRRFQVHEGLTEIAEGGASGADAQANQAASDLGIACQTFKADWQAHGRAAGPIRNQQMIDEFKPDAVIAFPGGRGTSDMVRRSKDHGLRVIQIL